MTDLDVLWAQQQLNEFLQSTAQVGYVQTPAVVVFGTQYRGRESQIAAQAQVVEQILDRVLPRWRQEAPEPTGAASEKRWSSLREMPARGLQQLSRQESLQIKLGDNAPALDAGRLHPWAWDSARSLWQSGHYAEAVKAAAMRVNAETQRKVGRPDVSDGDGD